MASCFFACIFFASSVCTNVYWKSEEYLHGVQDRIYVQFSSPFTFSVILGRRVLWKLDVYFTSDNKPLQDSREWEQESNSLPIHVRPWQDAPAAGIHFLTVLFHVQPPTSSPICCWCCSTTQTPAAERWLQMHTRLIPRWLQVRQDTDELLHGHMDTTPFSFAGALI
jgi:hypothetical protein